MLRVARNRISIQGDLFQGYMERLDKLGGSDAMKKGVNRALKKSKEYVNPKIENAMRKGNLPAGGKYSTGDTKKSIDKENSVNWIGGLGEIKVGFKFKESGLKSIFLMYGTPRMKPVAGLKNAIYGKKIQKEIAELQEEELFKVIKEIMEG